jgi:hypothetical protein
MSTCRGWPSAPFGSADRAMEHRSFVHQIRQPVRAFFASELVTREVPFCLEQLQNSVTQLVSQVCAHAIQEHIPLLIELPPFPVGHGTQGSLTIQAVPRKRR